MSDEDRIESDQEREDSPVSQAVPAGEPELLAEKNGMGKIFCYKANETYELRIEMESYGHSYFLTGEQWKEFTDFSGQDERREFFILLKRKYPDLDEHLIDDSMRMEFLRFIESTYDGSGPPKQVD